MRARASTTAEGCTTKAAAAADINRGADDILFCFLPDVCSKKSCLEVLFDLLQSEFNTDVGEGVVI